ncbi:MAG: T9SS type A sorting domain-containing protein [Bacteroidetes bacterium]|nr:T9SS type A sorting domain-containing protein [Bacteroidota bacterium]
MKNMVLVTSILLINQLLCAQRIAVNPDNWEGNWWTFNANMGYYFPTQNGDTTIFGIDNYSQSEIRTIHTYNGTSEFKVSLIPYLNTTGTNGDGMRIGFTNQWSEYFDQFPSADDSFIGLWVTDGFIYFRNQIEGDQYTSPEPIAVYSVGERVDWFISYSPEGTLKLHGTGISDTVEFTGSVNLNSYKFTISCQNATPGNGFDLLTVFKVDTSIKVNSDNWEGNWWSFNVNMGSYFPTQNGDTTIFGIDNYSQAEIRTIRTFTGMSEFNISLIPHLNTSGSNGDGMRIGFTNQWSEYFDQFPSTDDAFIGLWVSDGQIYFRNQIESDQYTSPDPVAGFSVGQNVDWTLCYSPSGVVKLYGTGITDTIEFTGTVNLNSYKFTISCQNATPGNGFDLFAVYYNRLDSSWTSVPVELFSFRHESDFGQVKLIWSTKTESDNFGFEIQKSENQLSWMKVGFVEGKGNTSVQQDYNFIDSKPSLKAYYRLKQMDTNGEFSYSDILEVSTVPTAFSLLQNYPNPFNPLTTISFTIPAASRVEILVYDITGAVVGKVTDAFYPAGYHKASFSATSLASGIYYYRMKAGNSVKTQKMVVLK